MSLTHFEPILLFYIIIAIVPQNLRGKFSEENLDRAYDQAKSKETFIWKGLIDVVVMS